MSIHHDKNKNPNTNQGNPSPQQPQGRPFSPPPPVGANSFGAARYGLTSQYGGSSSGGEFYEKLFAKITEQVKKTNEQAGGGSAYNVIRLLRESAGLAYSGIVITETCAGVTAAHVLIIEKTGKYPEPVIENVNNIRYSITRTPGEALDPKYVLQVKSAVRNVTKTAIENIIIADGTLVPNEFDIDSPNQFHELLTNAFNAVYVEIQNRVFDYRGANVAQHVTNFPKGMFMVGLQFNTDNSVLYDQTGMPVRQDVCVSLSFKTSNSGGGNHSLNQGEESIELVHTYGYVDFEFVGGSSMNGMPTMQKFLPNFVITHIQAVGESVPTPDLVLLGVASVLSLGEDMNWMQSFRASVPRKNEIDYNDVGALNVEGNIEQSPTGYGKKYDTKSKTATPMELNKLIQTLVYPTMMISIDVPKAGPETWYTRIFTDIKESKIIPGVKAEKNTAIGRANDYMVVATNGSYVPSDEPMFVETTNKIHGGFYREKDTFRDIRHLSCYLAVANHVVETGQQPSVIGEYTNTLYSDTPSVLRAAMRLNYIQDMSRQTAVVKQMYDRITFNGHFLARWVGALNAAGFRPVYNNAGGRNDMFVKRTSANFNSALVDSSTRVMSRNNEMPGSWTQYGAYDRTY